MNEAQECIAKVASAIKNKRCVIFFGSGISAGSGLPTGRELMMELLDIKDQQHLNLDLAITAQVLRHRNGPDWLRFRMRKIFLLHERRPNELHKILALLNSKYYITTNYDLLFDSVLEDFLGCGNLPVVIKDDHIPYADPVTYIKLHGDIAEPESIVLTYDDYDTRFEKNPNLLHLLYSLFAQNLVLFVGYSLRDANVLSVVRKIGRGDIRYARGMYILVTNPDSESVDFFKSLNVNVIPVDRRPGETQSDALQRFLLCLWNQTLDFDIYLNPQPRTLSYSSRLEIAISSYRRGDYPGALQSFDGLETVPERVWGADPGAFAQYSYFKLKTLDKLNRWEEMKSIGLQLLELLEKFSSLYPRQVIESIQVQIHASIGLPLMRACFFVDAQRYLMEALAKNPDNSVIGKDAMLLYADRHTVLACINLGLFYFGEKREIKDLSLIERHLAKAEELFRTYDDPDGPNEAHFLGRYFGACAFLRIAQIRTGELSLTAEVCDELRGYGWKSYREVSEGGNRVAYGKLAGRYCEAITFLLLAQAHHQGGNRESAAVYYDDSVEKLEGLLAGTDVVACLRLSPLESCKLHRALELAHHGKASLLDGNSELLERARKHHELFLHFMESDELRFMNQLVIATEDWVYTPLN